ncbi:MAG: penicillin-binding protein 2, partial [Clostridia bacterium]|nr:penicillin-binding protein 2 [Clostridia bacterium]
MYLTIDIGMQMCAEKALAENIFKIRADAKWDDPLSGEDAAAGAMTVEDCDTGEILAICSYPTYNLETYQEDLTGLLSDETSPLYNRALYGLYAPGSTFKVGVALAALEEGIIEKDTVIDTKGIYTYYEESNYTPRCWLYLMTGRSHGPIAVVEAIQESCNYF